MTSTDELERLLAEAQTDEPWTVVWYGDDSLPAIAIHRSTEDRICFMPTIQHPADGVQFEANAALIVAAVNALPELLALRKENERLRNEFPTREKQAFVMGLNCAAKSVRETSGGSAVCEQTRLLIADSLDHAVETARAAINQEPKP